MQRCWRQDPCLRPGVPEVLEALHILPLSSPSLQRLRRLDRSSPGFHDQVCSVLHEEEYQKCVPNLQGDDLVWLVEYLNEVRRQVALPHSTQAIIGSRRSRPLRPRFPNEFT